MRMESAINYDFMDKQEFFAMVKYLITLTSNNKIEWIRDYEKDQFYIKNNNLDFSIEKVKGTNYYGLFAYNGELIIFNSKDLDNLIEIINKQLQMNAYKHIKMLNNSEIKKYMNGEDYIAIAKEVKEILANKDSELKDLLKNDEIDKNSKLVNPISILKEDIKPNELLESELINLDEKTRKPIFKIWDWEIICIDDAYHLKGTSNQYMGGRYIRSSKIIRVDFEKNVVETLNSIYNLI